MQLQRKWLLLVRDSVGLSLPTAQQNLFFCISVCMLCIHWRCMYQCHVYMAFIYVHTYTLCHIRAYVYIYVYIYILIYVRIYIYTYIHTYVSITCMYDIPCSGASAIYGTRRVFRPMILFSGPASLPSIEDMCNWHTCCMLARHLYFSWLCVYIYIYIRTYVRIYTYLYIYMYVCMYTGVYVSTYVRAYVRTYVHIRIRIYRHTYSLLHSVAHA